MADEFMGVAPRPENGIWGYVNGVAVTDDVIARVVANAESGYPGVSVRSPGRPRQIDEDGPAVVVQFRVAEAKLRQLDERAKQRRITRSDLLRDAVDRELQSV